MNKHAYDINQRYGMPAVRIGLPGLKRGKTRVISVTGGKGGVGKSTVVVNLATALAARGNRVLVVDADMGLGNINVLLGLKPLLTLNDVFQGKTSLAEIIVDGPGGIRLVPAGSGAARYSDLGQEERMRFLEELESLDEDVDILLVDTQSGISNNVAYFNAAAQEIMVVVSPELTSLTDGYSLIKFLATEHGEKNFGVLVNMCRDSREGVRVFEKLAWVASRFINVSLNYAGCVVRDERVLDAVRRQKSVIELYPRSAAAQCFSDLACNLVEHPAPARVKGNIQFFFRRNHGALRVVGSP